MQQGHDVPAVVLGGTRRKGGIEVVGHGEQPTDDVVRLQTVRFDQCAQQLIGGRQDLGGIVACNRGGAANSVQSY